ncbi:hypothetical protein J6590_079408 [Homalodisca vitripennis]|nr:hypothetical protein J6590_079408 [Homalodisca vitripennis]
MGEYFRYQMTRQHIFGTSSLELTEQDTLVQKIRWVFPLFEGPLQRNSAQDEGVTGILRISRKKTVRRLMKHNSGN